MKDGSCLKGLGSFLPNEEKKGSTFLPFEHDKISRYVTFHSYIRKLIADFAAFNVAFGDIFQIVKKTIVQIRGRGQLSQVGPSRAGPIAPAPTRARSSL